MVNSHVSIFSFHQQSRQGNRNEATALSMDTSLKKPCAVTKMEAETPLSSSLHFTGIVLT